MEQGDDPVLQLGREIDEEVAAGDQVELGEGGVADHVVRREDAHLAQLLDHAVGVALLGEPAGEPLRADVVGDRRRIAPDPGGGERAGVDVGREDLHVRAHVPPLHLLPEQDADRIGLLAGGAAEHPDPHRVVAVLAREDRRHHLPGQDVELLRVAEELGDADEKVVEEVLDLVRVVAQVLRVGVDLLDLHHLHAALDPAQEGLLLVAVEVVPGAAAQDGRDPGQGPRRLGEDDLEALALAQAGEVAGIGRDAIGDLRKGDHEVRHRAGEVGGGEVGGRLARRPLGDGEPAPLLDGGEAEGAVPGGAVQDDPERGFALVLGQRDEEAVDGAARARPLAGLAGAEAAVGEGDDQVRIAQVDAGPVERGPVLDGHEAAVPRRDDALEPRLVEGFAVLQNDDDRLVRRRRERGDEGREAVGLPGRGGDGDDERPPGVGRRFALTSVRFPAGPARVVRHWSGAPARPPSPAERNPGTRAHTGQRRRVVAVLPDRCPYLTSMGAGAPS